MTQYLFSDVFERFSRFFKVKGKDQSRFLYDIAFGFLPRTFAPEGDDRIIYDEEDDVTEMYFVTDGVIAVCYSLVANGITNKLYSKGKTLNSSNIT